MSETGYTDVADLEAEHVEDIRVGREYLHSNLVAALHAVQVARSALQTLQSDRVYDVEYIEGDTGRDILHHLDDAARTLRAANAIRRTVPNDV